MPVLYQYISIMRTRPAIVLTLSMGLNVLLATLYFLPPKEQQTAQNIGPKEVSQSSTNSKVKTHIIVRKQFFSWSEIESDDYPTYISNLKAISCPDATIRDIITADVNQLYAQKREKDVPIGGPQWWRAFPDAVSTQAAIARQSQLEAERRDLLNRLLGLNEDSSRDGASPVQPHADLEGPLLGNLPNVLKQAVREIVMAEANRKKALLEEHQKSGKQINPAAWIQIDTETKDDLARVLTPAQLEDYACRYSATASFIQQETQYFDPSADEIRKMFQARASLDSQIEALTFATDAASVKKRVDLERQREEAIQQSLGPERYKLFKIAQDPAFKDAQLQGKQAGASPRTILSLYEINQLAFQEQQRIKTDLSLDKEQREHALLQLQLDREKSTREILQNKTMPIGGLEEDLPPPVPQAP